MTLILNGCEMEARDVVLTYPDIVQRAGYYRYRRDLSITIRKPENETAMLMRSPIDATMPFPVLIINCVPSDTPFDMW